MDVDLRYWRRFISLSAMRSENKELELPFPQSTCTLSCPDKYSDSSKGQDNFVVQDDYK